MSFLLVGCVWCMQSGGFSPGGTHLQLTYTPWKLTACTSKLMVGRRYVFSFGKAYVPMSFLEGNISFDFPLTLFVNLFCHDHDETCVMGRVAENPHAALRIKSGSLQSMTLQPKVVGWHASAERTTKPMLLIYTSEIWNLWPDVPILQASSCYKEKLYVAILYNRKDVETIRHHETYFENISPIISPVSPNWSRYSVLESSHLYNGKS